MKNKDRFSKMILMTLYLCIWAFAVIAFWLFNSGSDALGYSMMYLWILLPTTTFILSFLIGKNDHWKSGKWGVTAVFGFMYMLAEYATFRTANMVAFHKIDPPEWEMIPMGMAVSAMGMAVGAGVRRIRFKSSKRS